MMPAGPGADFVLVQPHVALFGLELGFNAPPGAAHVGQGFQRSVLGSVGQVVAGFAAVQILAIDRPEDLARLALLGYPHSRCAVTVGTRSLAARRYRNLPPGLCRQRGWATSRKRNRQPPTLPGDARWPGPVPASPGPARSCLDTPAAPQAPPPPHNAQHPMSIPAADTAAGPPTPDLWAPHGPETPP